MTREELIIVIAIIFAVLLASFVLFLINASSQPNVECDKKEPPGPRITLPTDSYIYMFSLPSQLKPEEWELILNAGWEFLTCNIEQSTEYVGSYPEAPSYRRTRWNYVFKLKNYGHE